MIGDSIYEVNEFFSTNSGLYNHMKKYSLEGEIVNIPLSCSQDMATELVKFLNGDVGNLFEYNISLCRRLFIILQSDYGLKELNKYVNDSFKNLEKTRKKELEEYDPNLFKSILPSEFLDSAFNPETSNLSFNIRAFNSINDKKCEDWQNLVEIPKYLPYYNYFYNSPFYENGENIIPTEDVFRERFEIITEGMLSNLTYENYVIAGGSLSFLFQDIKNKIRIPKYSDVDIFVWGKTHENRLNTIKSILQKLPEDKLVFQNKNVITVLVKNARRNIQIINSGVSSLRRILESFDNDISKIAFDGTKLICPIETLVALSFQTSKFTSYTGIRIYKMLKRGFCVMNQDNEIIYKKSLAVDCESKTTYKNKYLFIDNTDEETIKRTEYMMKQMFGKKYELIKNDTLDETEYKINWIRIYSNLNTNDILDVNETKLDIIEIRYLLNGYSGITDNSYSKIIKTQLIDNTKNPFVVNIGVCEIIKIYTRHNSDGNIDKNRYNFYVKLDDSQRLMVKKVIDRFALLFNNKYQKGKRECINYESIMSRLESSDYFKIVCSKYLFDVSSDELFRNKYRGTFNIKLQSTGIINANHVHVTCIATHVVLDEI